MFLVTIFLAVSVGATFYASGSPTDTAIFDLSHPFDENTIYWPGVQTFRFTKKITNNDLGFFYATNNFEAGEHGGTHLDAPYHFNKDGAKIGDIPLEKLLVNGIRVDVRKEVQSNPNYGLEKSKLIEWEKKNGKIDCPTVILVDFGWASKYPNKKEYFGSETMNPEDFHFPGISFEAADWIANHTHVVGVGVDSASVDQGINSQNPQTHIKITAVNKYMLENVNLNGTDLPEKGFKLFITPMKIREGTGAPCRIIATVKK